MEQNKTISLLFCIVHYLLQYTVLNEYICGQCRSKGGEVGYTPWAPAAY